MNLFEAENKLKGYTDENLAREMLSPSGMTPQYMVMSELQRRKKMREESASKPSDKTSVADEMKQGIMSMIQRQQPVPDQIDPQQMQPSQQAPQQAPVKYGFGGLIDTYNPISHVKTSIQDFGKPEQTFNHMLGNTHDMHAAPVDAVMGKDWGRHNMPYGNMIPKGSTRKSSDYDKYNDGKKGLLQFAEGGLVSDTPPVTDEGYLSSLGRALSGMFGYSPVVPEGGPSNNPFDPQEETQDEAFQRLMEEQYEPVRQYADGGITDPRMPMYTRLRSPEFDYETRRAATEGYYDVLGGKPASTTPALPWTDPSLGPVSNIDGLAERMTDSLSAGPAFNQPAGISAPSDPVQPSAVPRPAAVPEYSPGNLDTFKFNDGAPIAVGPNTGVQRGSVFPDRVPSSPPGGSELSPAMPRDWKEFPPNVPWIDKYGAVNPEGQFELHEDDRLPAPPPPTPYVPMEEYVQPGPDGPGITGRLLEWFKQDAPVVAPVPEASLIEEEEPSVDTSTGLTPKRTPAVELTPSGSTVGVPGKVQSMGDLSDFEAMRAAIGHVPGSSDALFAEIAARQAEMREGMDDQYKNDKWMAIAQMGAAMASGESPHFAANFGAGATAGIEALRDAKQGKQKTEMALLGMDTNLAMARDAAHRGDVSTSAEIYSMALNKNLSERELALKAASLSAKGSGNSLKAMEFYYDTLNDQLKSIDRQLSGDSMLGLAPLEGAARSEAQQERAALISKIDEFRTNTFGEGAAVGGGVAPVSRSGSPASLALTRRAAGG